MQVIKENIKGNVEYLKHTYLLTVNGKVAKICLYQSDTDTELDVEDDENIRIEQIT
tara:strand:- start:1171 stop:1338 length:168 start_codon:yes stop_codon:yes gene_type:complete